MSKPNFNMEMFLTNKSDVASAFGALERADNISDEEATIIRKCLSKYNSMLDAEKKENEEPESDNVRLGSVVKLWRACNDPIVAVEALQRLEETIDGETQEILHDIVSMIREFSEIV